MTNLTQAQRVFKECLNTPYKEMFEEYRDTPYLGFGDAPTARKFSKWQSEYAPQLQVSTTYTITDLLLFGSRSINLHQIAIKNVNYLPHEIAGNGIEPGLFRLFQCREDIGYANHYEIRDQLDKANELCRWALPKLLWAGRWRKVYSAGSYEPKRVNKITSWILNNCTEHDLCNPDALAFVKTLEFYND